MKLYNCQAKTLYLFEFFGFEDYGNVEYSNEEYCNVFVNLNIDDFKSMVKKKLPSEDEVDIFNNYNGYTTGKN